MKIKLKISLIPKGISYFLMLTLMVFCTACGGDDDEPDNSGMDDDGSGILLSETIPSSILPGEWIVDKCVSDENGKEISINLQFTILPFSVKQESERVYNINGSELWAEIYEPFTESNTKEGVKQNHSVISFYRPAGLPLAQSRIYSMNIIVDNVDNDGYFIGVLSGFKFSNNILIGEGAFSLSNSENYFAPSNGKIYLRKLQ